MSTTHAIVGAVVGMTMVSAGPGAVNWAEHTDSFPFLGVRSPPARVSVPVPAACRLPPAAASASAALLLAAGVGTRCTPSLQPCAPRTTPTRPRDAHAPHLQGVSSILLSWLFSPLFTGALSLVLFVLLRGLVLRSPAAYRRAFFVLPVFVFGTCFL